MSAICCNHPINHIRRFSTVSRLFSTLEVVQYIRGITSVLWGITSVLWGITSVLWRLFSTVGDTFSTYCGGIASVLWRLFSTVGDNISTCGGITSVLWGITSVLWRVFSTVEGYLKYCGGITAVHVEDSFIDYRILRPGCLRSYADMFIQLARCKFYTVQRSLNSINKLLFDNFIIFLVAKFFNSFRPDTLSVCPAYIFVSLTVFRCFFRTNHCLMSSRE